MDEQTLGYYEQNAPEISRRYEAAGEGVASLFPFVYKRGDRVLEIGAGSGRDSARLLALGVDLRAAEPSSAMRARALAAHPELSGRLFAGHLPGGLGPELDGPWDGILLSAVIMHIADADLFDAAFQLRERLVKDGCLLVSMPVDRRDVAPGSDRDGRGRLMIVRPAAQVRLLFERLGFSLENQWTSADSAGRDMLWTSLLFRLSGAGAGHRAIDRVESIINADRKVATYKLALVRALCDIAMTSWASATWQPGRAGGMVGVPLGLVARHWVRYYWPLLEADAEGAGGGDAGRSAGRRVSLPQINAEVKGGRPIAFRRVLGELVEACRPMGGFTACTRMQLDGTMPSGIAVLHRAAVKVIASTIVRGPVTFAGNARGEPEFGFQPGSGRGDDDGRVLVRADVWRELALMGHWIRDAVILRWAEMTARLSEGAVRPGAVVDRLLQVAEPFRQDPVIRSFYEEHRDGLRCVWTGRPLAGGLEVDHAIPFAFWQASPAWNLLPAARSVNNAKRDKLPSARIVRAREEAIVHCWRMLADRYAARFQRDAAALLGSLPGANWEKPLLAGFLQAIEYTASTRGAERWEPQGAVEAG